MSIFSRKSSFSSKTSRNISRGAVALAVAAGFSLAAGAALADDPTTMAPPIGASSPEGFGNASYGNGLSGMSGVNASADSVFNWQEIPADQQVPLTRATFDQGGYQLYDTQGETIVVPFTNQNLYVMKFATSSDGTLYFENTGGFPVLYVPQGGFVENATVAGARWYPFGQDFHPTEPVFLGIAPSYTDFIDLGWYPNTRFYGGYYGNTSFLEGGLFLPTIGLFFSIGGHPYYGWNSYHHYYENHPGYVHVHYYDHNFYHYAGSNYRTFAPDRRFGGFHEGGFHDGDFHRDGFHDGGNRYSHAGGSYRGNYGGNPARRDGAIERSGAASGFGERSGFSGRTFRGATGFGGGHGNSTGGHSYGGGRSYFGGGGNHSDGGGNHSDGGGQSFGGGSHSDGGSSQSYTHSFRGTSSGGGRSFGGARTFGGGGQSFGGGHSSYSNNNSSGHSDGGSHSFSGGQRSRTFSSGGGRSGGGGGRQDNAKQDGGGHGGGGHDGGGHSR